MWPADHRVRLLDNILSRGGVDVDNALFFVPEEHKNVFKEYVSPTFLSGLTSESPVTVIDSEERSEKMNLNDLIVESARGLLEVGEGVGGEL